MFARSASRLVRSVSRVGVRGYADNAMSFTFASQSQVFYKEKDIRQVDVPSFSGNFGILANHVPTLAVIKPGVLTVFESDGSTKKYFVSSGMISVNEDSSVQILAEEAADIDSLDLGSARDLLSKANTEVTSAHTDKEKAEAMIAVEVAEALVKAAESA